MRKFRIMLMGGRLDKKYISMFKRMYKVEVELVQQIGDGQIDAIIIGNNGGKGVFAAAGVPQEFKSRSIVVWNDFTPNSSMEKPYTELKFQNFSSRLNLPKELAVFLGIDWPKHVEDSCENLAPSTL